MIQIQDKLEWSDPVQCWAQESFTFEPRRWLRNGHLQTIVGNYLSRPALDLPTEIDDVLTDPADGTRVRCVSHWQSNAEEQLTVLLVHGLEGSSQSRYVVGLTHRLWASGCNVIRMNMRNCGGTDELTPTLYHSGLSSDVAEIIEQFTVKKRLRKFALVGYSMGGNLVLKLAGEWGARKPLAAVAAVCPAIDLAAGSDALHEPANRLYEWHFLRGLMRRFRRKAALYPHIYEPDAIGPIRSLREFDDRILARYADFAGADDYYERAASARVVDQIAVPTLILQALDDPFIRLTRATRKKLIENPWIRLVETAHGGHCAFLSNEQGAERHWAEAVVVRSLLKVAGDGR